MFDNLLYSLPSEYYFLQLKKILNLKTKTFIELNYLVKKSEINVEIESFQIFFL